MLVGLVGGLIRESMDPTAKSLVVAAFAALVILVLGALVLGRQFLTNAFNRRIGATVLFALFTVLVHRLLGLASGTPVVAILTADLLLVSCVQITAALTLFRPLWTCGAIHVLGAVMLYTLPHHAMGIFTSTVVCGHGVLIFTLARAKRPQG